jgi:hypothetical protein
MPAGSFALQARTASRPVGNPVVVPAGLPATSSEMGSTMPPAGLAFAGSHLDIVDHGYPCAPGAEARAEVQANGSRGFGRWYASAATRVADLSANLIAFASAQLKQAFAGEAAEVTVT